MPEWLLVALMVLGPFIFTFLVLVLCFGDGLDPPKWPWHHRW